jgi:uncharacterized protein YcfJ
MRLSCFRPVRDVLVSAALAGTLLLAGCSGQPLTTREKGTIAGGAIGLGAGAIVGSTVGAPGTGAAIGGVVGAGTAYAIGNSMQNSENRRSYSERGASV